MQPSVHTCACPENAPAAPACHIAGRSGTTAPRGRGAARHQPALRAAAAARRGIFILLKGGGQPRQPILLGTHLHVERAEPLLQVVGTAERVAAAGHDASDVALLLGRAWLRAGLVTSSAAAPLHDGRPGVQRGRFEPHRRCRAPGWRSRRRAGSSDATRTACDSVRLYRTAGSSGCAVRTTVQVLRFAVAAANLYLSNA